MQPAALRCARTDRMSVCLFGQASAQALQTAAKPAAAAAKHKTAISKPKPEPVHEWTADDVCAFFSTQKLGEYIAAVAENGVDGSMLQQLAAQKGLPGRASASSPSCMRSRSAALWKAALREHGTQRCPRGGAFFLNVPQLHRDMAPSHSFCICTRTGLTPATNWADTGLLCATSAPHPYIVHLSREK